MEGQTRGGGLIVHFCYYVRYFVEFDMCHALAYLTLAVKKEAAATSTITIQAIVFCPRLGLDLPWDLRQWRVKPHAHAQLVEAEAEA